MFFFLAGNNKKSPQKDDTELVIDLELKIEENPLRTTHMGFPFLDSIPERFKGVVNKDSSFVGYISTLDLERSQKPIDYSEHESAGIYCLSGYKDGKQFYILDSNSNFDFSDDEMTMFEKNITYTTSTDREIQNSFPIHKMKINKLGEHGVYGDSIYISLYPNANHFGYTRPSASIQEELKRKLLVVARFIDYSYGTFSVLDKKYKVALGKYGMFGVDMIFREYDSAFHKFNEIGREEYKLLDTLKIAQNYYRIDELLRDPTKLKLKKLEINDLIYGFREGYTIHDYPIEDLDGNETTLKSLFDGKKLVLLDFWGTWCAPCKELTPDLLVLNERYKEKISFVSLAYEKDPLPVKDYVTKNKMDWHHGIIKGTPKSGNNDSKLLSDLRIAAYPTFILLDSDLKILYRSYSVPFADMVAFLDKSTFY